MFLKSFVLITFLILGVFSSIQAQTDTTSSIPKKIIVLSSGDEIVGKIISDDGREILIISDKVGKLYIAKSQIREIKDMEEMKEISNGDYMLEGPFTTRYAFTTNALPLKRNVNYAMINLYGPEIHFAVTNRLSLGIMSTWIGSPMALDAKFTFPTADKKLNFALGTILGTSGYILKGKGYGGLGWGTMTYGGRIDNISFSAGYGFIGNFDNATKYHGGPMFSFAAIKRIGKKTSFIFDSMISITKGNETKSSFYYDQYGNYVQSVTTTPVTNTFFFLMPGVRYQKTENKAFQVSLAGVINMRGSNSTSFPMPMCSWFYKL